MRGVLSVFAVLFVLFMSVSGALAPQAFAAGGGGTEPAPFPKPSTNLGGSFSFGNNFPNYRSSSYTSGNDLSANFGLSFDPAKFSLRSANWSFSPNSWNPNTWTATAYMYGYRGDSEQVPQGQSWSQDAQNGNSNVYASLGFETHQYEWADAPVMSIDGNLNITNAVFSSFSSTNFRYWEGYEEWWTWPNGHHEDPVINQIPAWYAQYYVQGRFLTETGGGIGAMAASSSAAVPEPSTLALMLGSGFAGLLLSLRRRWR